ncbi:hypothetical protein chiPu_0011233 [Chiloscyllium punctatum]|uniref:Secreted protein n=1 Tax=Chiloscyllium punctatum TaxID=137246 RepID=A0A401SQT2_CHIPU|nr:hypothetical protein [Chiloscyllium punctatum]
MESPLLTLLLVYLNCDAINSHYTGSSQEKLWVTCLICSFTDDLQQEDTAQKQDAFPVYLALSQQVRRLQKAYN